nr:hypothetical protein [Allomuricauda sp.]
MLRLWVPICISFCAAFFSSPTLAQTNTEDREYYTWFDGVTGPENANLFEGTLNIEKYAALEGSHKFYSSNDYLKGYITYDGETYFDVDLKYDIYEDQLLLPLRSESTVLLLQLVKHRVDGFGIDGHDFVRLQSNTATDHSGEFYEILLEQSHFTLYKRHKKVGYPNYQKNFIRYKFVSKDEYVLVYGDQQHWVKNKKDVLKVFKEHKLVVKDRTLESLRKNDKDAYMIKLMQLVHRQFLLHQNVENR